MFRSLYAVCTCGRGKKLVHNEHREEIRAPYCGEFREMLTKFESEAYDYMNENMNEKDKEAIDGRHVTSHGGRWNVVTLPNSTRIRVRQWVKAGKKGGVPHARGDRMKTWQVVQENTLHTFDVMKNKTYRVGSVSAAVVHLPQLDLLAHVCVVDAPTISMLSPPCAPTIHQSTQSSHTHTHTSPQPPVHLTHLLTALPSAHQVQSPASTSGKLTNR